MLVWNLERILFPLKTRKKSSLIIMKISLVIC